MTGSDMAASTSVPAASLPDIERLIIATERSAAVTLAAALITASGRSHSVDEAVELSRDIEHSLFPRPSTRPYQAWKESAKTDEPHT